MKNVGHLILIIVSYTTLTGRNILQIILLVLGGKGALYPKIENFNIKLIVVTLSIIVIPTLTYIYKLYFPLI